MRQFRFSFVNVFGAVSILVLLALAWLLVLLLQGAKSIDLAGWGQAVATTVSIWAGYTIASAQISASERQDRRRRFEALQAVGAASRDALSCILEFQRKFESTALSNDQFRSRFRRVPLETAARSLEAIPAHEIGNARIASRVVHLSGLVRQALEELDATRIALEGLQGGETRTTPGLGRLGGEARADCDGIADCLREESRNDALKLSKAERHLLQLQADLGVDAPSPRPTA